MMAIQTNNSSDNPSTERARYLLNQNIELEEKRRKALQARIPPDPNAWQCMRENFEVILLGDPVFSEQNGIECKLWQLHYSRIKELRAIFNAAVASPRSNRSQNEQFPSRGGPDRVAKIRSQFKAFLTEATGFYLDLMLKIRAKYGLPSETFYDDMDGQISLSSEVKKGLISCHRCFIYLGDLARYKGVYGEGESKALDFATASSYYMQANSLLPSSGNPHHQLAILAAYSDDVLVSIYRYFRSLAVDSPFTTARENLIIVFEKNRQIYKQGAGDLKASSNVSVLKLFGIGFVRLNGILFTRTSLETFGEVFSVVRTDFLKLLSSGPEEEYSFGPDDAVCRVTIVRLIAILIFTIHNVIKETVNQSYAEIMQRSVLLQSAFTASFEIMGLILERCTQLKDLSSSYLLPGIMVFVEWLACHQDMAVGNDPDKKQANARYFFWNNFVAFLNKIGGYMSVDENEITGLLALPEDFELRGFLPLVPAQVKLNFSKVSYKSDGNKEKKVRVGRIIAAGKALANVVRLGDKRVYYDKNVKKFIIGVEPRVSDVVEEEEDDEVIVFKPSMVEKQVDRIVPNSPMTVKHVDWIVPKSHMTVKHVDWIVPNSPRADMNDTKGNLGIFSGRQPMSFSKASTDNLQPTGPGNLVNGMADLNLGKNGLFEKSENYHNAMQAPPLASSLPRPACIGNGFNCSQPVPSKFDVIKPPSVTATEVKKNPITRPLRPPGFDSLRSKVVNDPVSSLSMKTESTEIPRVDAYRLPAVCINAGFNNSFNHSQQPYHNSTNNFPFPGKTTMEKPKNRQDHNEFSEQTRLFQEQGHQLHKGSQGLWMI